ncbi:hypothetical protein PHYPSEUDO_008832 [Phytophthora pseudosyringae]|uniref:Uncharacterized protein n=1 Tax=Phytophthora pseudosyringae TaxID=221518 RepID=A0A8T1VGK2_9STRA|nr:hypothetical protein PHYPSEUDO_008832 [Phytophthora pseudosyringae]
MPALCRYYGIHGHLDVPFKFAVGDETWPKATWGWILGPTVAKFRTFNTFPSQVAASKAELEQMDFCFTSIYERDWDENVLPALATYRQEFGDCLVEQPFVVPSELPWPKKAWGLPLGRIIRSIRSSTRYVEQAARDMEILKSLAFAWDVRGFVWNERVAPALKVYGEGNGHCRVPNKCVVPSRDPWPEKSWGVELGKTLYMFRKQGSYFGPFGCDAEWLDALGLGLRVSAAAYGKRVAPLLDMYAS